MLKEYSIAPQSGTCSVTQRSLAEGEIYYAVLFETPEGFDRRDFSLEAWSEPPQGFYCYWKSRVPVRQTRKQLFVDAEVLINLFQRLENNDEPVKQHFRFVLALILLRKRLLKYDQTEHRSGQEWWKMRMPRDQSEHWVLNPRMNDEQIQTVSQQLSAILHGDAGALDNVSGDSP